MTTFFLLVCGVSVIFFLVFFWQCGKPRQPAKKYEYAIHPSELVTADSLAGRRGLAQMESQMAEFLGSHERGAMVLGLMPSSLCSQDMRPRGQRDAGSQEFREMARQSSSAVMSDTDAEQIA